MKDDQDLLMINDQDFPQDLLKDDQDLLKVNDYDFP
jgi:hypothetical protein